MAISTPGGEVVGQISGTVHKKRIKVHYTWIDDPKHRGKGYAMWAYLGLIEYAHALGKAMVSDYRLTIDSWRVYGALIRRGYRVTRCKSFDVLHPYGESNVMFRCRPDRSIFTVRPKKHGR